MPVIGYRGYTDRFNNPKTVDLLESLHGAYAGKSTRCQIVAIITAVEVSPHTEWDMLQLVQYDCEHGKYCWHGVEHAYSICIFL